MGSSRPRNSTRARKARSVKPSPKPPHKPTAAAMAKRLASRKPYKGKPSPTEVLRETRGEIRKDAPAMTDVGTELRSVLKQLERVESYVIVARMALDGQNAEQDNEVAWLLQHDVGDLLFKLVRSLENIAARCDGGPRSDRDDDDELKDADMDAGGQP